jgi:putative ABC transport system ATP-binding protein
LLYCLAGILVPDSGQIRFDDLIVSAASPAQRCHIRSTRCGFVFQFAELVPELSLGENIELPLRLTGASRRVAKRAAAEVMSRLGIAELADRMPDQVSGGQAQRAAVARAVVHEPNYVFADEPTGSLDSHSGELVLRELVELTKERNSSLVMVTHDAAVAATAQRQVKVSDGRCESTSPTGETPGVADHQGCDQ